MTPNITTIEQAEKFFLENSEGTCTVERADGSMKECASFPEAKEFLEAEAAPTTETEAAV